MENVEIKQKFTKIDWEKFNVSEDKVIIESGTRLKLGFTTIEESTIKVLVDSKEGEEPQEESKPCLILTVDYVGKEFLTKPKRLTVTSKRFAKIIKRYFERELLFKNLFEIEKTGAKFTTQYAMYDLGLKPDVRINFEYKL